MQQDLVVEFAEQFTNCRANLFSALMKMNLPEHLQKLCYQNQWTKIYCDEDKLKKLIATKHYLHPDIATCEAAITSCEFWWREPEVLY